jgi:membrane protein
MSKRKSVPMPLKVVRATWRALRAFIAEGGIDKSSILAYYSIFSSFFLLIFFSFLFSRFIGDPNDALQSMYPFSPEFFRQIAPIFFQRAAELTSRVRELGLVGLAVFFFMGILVFKKMVQFVNEMFFIAIRRGFLVRRIKEFGLILIGGVLIVSSFLLTGLISTMTTILEENGHGLPRVNPAWVHTIDGFIVRYIIPFLITFLFFFILFKWIPEKKVATWAAFSASLFAALLWEIVKRGYTYYLVNISLLRKMQGPIVSIILFGFWMEITMGIMLYGAKMTYLLDEGKDA